MTILYLHGMASSHESHIGNALRACLPQHRVLIPDTSIDPSATMRLIDDLMHREHVDLIVGHSLGGFIAQKYTGVKKILLNPSLGTSFMYLFLGKNRYKHARQDGQQTYSVTRALCHQYRQMELAQYAAIDDSRLHAAEDACTIGLFARHDLFTRLSAHRFAQHYTDHRFISGSHYPTLPTVRDEIAPIVEELLAREQSC
jgi:predicted esterase YcpF (UPF0227 family)